MNIKHDTNAALDFLQRWEPGGPWVLTSIVPDSNYTTTKTFRDVDMAHEWIEFRQGRENIYFTVNPVKRDTQSKPKKTDIAALAWLHVDVDPRPGEELGRERVRALKMLEGYEPKPTVIIDSGGGYQAFWKLEQAVSVDDMAIDAMESYGQHIEIMLGGDHCRNIDRIMRLPGTVNVPNEIKLKKGRKPALALLVSADWQQAYPLTAFKQAAVGHGSGATPAVDLPKDLPAVELSRLPVSELCKTIILHGHDPDNTNKHPSRSEWLFGVCCEMVRAGCDADVMAAVILNPNYKISESVLEKGGKARAYAERQITKALAEASEPEELQELNDKHFVVTNLGGKFRVASKMRDPVMNREWWTFQPRHDFVDRYMNRFVVIGHTKNGDEITRPLGQWWLEHRRRREYNQIAFAPEVEVADDIFNMWEGFAYEAKAGELHQKYLTHLRENICAGEEDAYEYILRWMARTVQVPSKPAEVAVVLIGNKGTGKTQFAYHFGRLFGRHYLAISDPRHLIGNFNAHLQDCVVLLADEVTPASDKKQEGVLKMLITEPSIVLERKGVDATTTPNCTHIVMASNNSHAINYSEDERRYLVLNVGNRHRQDREYFGAIMRDMKAGGYENLLHFLKNLDISKWDHSKVPFTSAAQDQLVASMGNLKSWLVDILHTGILPGEDAQKGDDPSLMCLGTAAEQLEMNSRTLLSKLAKMGVIIDAQPVQRKVYRTLDGELVLKAQGTNAKALPRRMYRVAPKGELRTRYTLLAPDGWPEDGNVWRFESDPVPDSPEVPF